MEMPHEFDDPNATIASIISALKAKAIDVPFASNKLKSGSGDQCLFVLDKLTEMALENANFHFSKIEVMEEAVVENSEDSIQVDEAEILADQLEEEEDVALAEDEDDDDEHHIVRLSDANVASRDQLYANELHEVPLKEILHNFTDANTMTAELRRVIPQLKVTIRSNLKDWRMHAEQIQKYEESINDQFKEIKPYLVQNVEEITQSMERIQSREAHLNTQFDGLLQIYRVRQNELAAIGEQYRESSGTLNSRAETLNNLNKELTK
uniref:Uncharacterized protein n=1 Tax=Ditylenchus dipsaci TaxID=166011 RepID=A0A915CPA0_9BILA